MACTICSGVASADHGVASDAGVDGRGPVISFSGDADEGVDLFGQAPIAEEEGGDEEDGEGEDVEPEDDFNAAWEVLELARAIHEKGKDDDDETKMKLAETYIALGDVSLETGMCNMLHLEVCNATDYYCREI